MSLAKRRTALALLVTHGLLVALPVQALPPPEDTPEEVLRTEVITEARSPLDGSPMTAAEYAELEAQMRDPSLHQPQVAQRYRDLVTLLRLRRAIRSVFPFLLR
ncbi:MAG: hypothetical protein HY785_18060 [Oscillatoriophycideae cyanobacterium NC_groundwater_1537_Pr4_S-0.65um_50_18]|nr:hypothetical protein [Oscillatoriophycideae cyanobacterium NC_groundwater_1537_Pr4_S-0.65um_50_18]